MAYFVYLPGHGNSPSVWHTVRQGCLRESEEQIPGLSNQGTGTTLETGSGPVRLIISQDKEQQHLMTLKAREVAILQSGGAAIEQNQPNVD